MRCIDIFYEVSLLIENAWLLDNRVLGLLTFFRVCLVRGLEICGWWSLSCRVGRAVGFIDMRDRLLLEFFMFFWRFLSFLVRTRPQDYSYRIINNNKYRFIIQSCKQTVLPNIIMLFGGMVDKILRIFEICFW